MSLKCVICLKKVSEERDLSLDSEGYIGKSVPLIPILLGVFILRQKYSKVLGEVQWLNRSSFLKGCDD